MRSLSVTFSFRCVHLVQLLGSGMFQESKDQIELIQSMWTSLVDKNTFFYIVFQALNPAQQVMLGRCLGYANFIIYKVPQGSYQLRLHMRDEHEVAHRLAKMAVQGGRNANFENLQIDGKRKHIPEDNNFWSYISTTRNGLKMLPGEINRQQLEFDFFMTGADVCNMHVMRLQSRWRGFVAQRHHMHMRYYALLVQFMFRAHRAMKYMREARLAVDKHLGLQEDVMSGIDMSKTGKLLVAEAVKIFVSHLLMLHKLKDNAELRAVYREKGLGAPLTKEETMMWMREANIMVAAKLKAVNQIRSSLKFMQKLVGQRHARDKLAHDVKVKELQGEKLKSLRVVDIQKVIEVGTNMKASD